MANTIVSFFVNSPWSQTPPYIPQLIIDYPNLYAWTETPGGDGQCPPLGNVQLQVSATEQIMGQIESDPTYTGTVRLIS